MIRWMLLSLALPALLGADVRARGEEVTFSGEIATLVHRRCGDCHGRSGVTALRLLTYDDVARHATAVQAAIRNDLMPPWKPLGDHGEFLETRRLTSEEKRRFELWFQAGMPIGDRDAVPLPPEGREGWIAGKPDLALSAAIDAGTPATASPILSVELPIGDDVNVAAIEIRPHAAAFRHALIWLDLPLLTAVEEIAPETKGGASIWSSFVPSSVRERVATKLPSPFRPAQRAKAVEARDRRVIGVWSFDRCVQSAPAGSAWRFPAGARLIVEAAAIGEPYRGPLEIGLHFARETPQKLAAVVPLEMTENGLLGVGDDRVMRTRFTVNVDCELHDIAPHIDSRGEELRVGLTLPNGRRESLLWIDSWEARWENSLRYRRCVQVPAGSQIEGQLLLRSPRETPAQVAIMHIGRPIVNLTFTTNRASDYDELIRSIQRKQIEAARAPVVDRSVR